MTDADSMPANGELAQIVGQPSYVLRSRTVDLAITQRGAMLGPVRFLGHPQPIEPYAIAPWALEEAGVDADPFLQALRGDFMCSAFGDNAERIDERQLPPHGDTVHSTWTPLRQLKTECGVSLRLGCELATQGGRCEATTILLEGHTIVYQRHDFSGVTGPINPGHHAMLQFPQREGAGSLSFSPFIYAQTLAGEWSAGLTRTSLAENKVLYNLRRVMRRDGTETDLTAYPARLGFEDAVLLCADPNAPFAWSAATFHEERFVWFALRNPKLLPSTLLWFSNGGRSASPWNNRHLGVVGIEDTMGSYGHGLARSAGPNDLTARGIATSIQLSRDETLRIPYIQGVARIPPDFDRVESIEAKGEQLLLRAESQEVVTVDCCTSFLESGCIRGLCED